jgi:hypothetical protein
LPWVRPAESASDAHRVAQGCFDNTHMQELKVWSSFILRIDTLNRKLLENQ